jgi:hypothetical protein
MLLTALPSKSTHISLERNWYSHEPWNILKQNMEESAVMPFPFSMQLEETNDVSHGHILAFITICMLMA